MFKSISWQQYLHAILIVSAIYYLVILMLYYKRDIRYCVANFPSRRSQLWKFITGRTETDESDVLGGADLHESTNEIDSAKDDIAHQITHE